MKLFGIGLLLAQLALFVASPAVASESGLVPALAPFEPLVGRTYKALVNAEKEMYDVAHWEAALAGHAVRVRHSVADGVYGGETTIMWDQEAETFVFTYFTTAGFFTRGTMSFDEQGRLIGVEKITGAASGVREVRSEQSLGADGTLTVRTRKLRGETWEAPVEVVYVEAPDAEVRIPPRANER